MNNNRRKFERLVIPEHAVAVDENGRQLGRVKEAGGGGMLVTVDSVELLREFTVGRCLRVTVVEPQSGTATVMDVEVKYTTDNGIGMEFVNFGAGVP